MNSEKVETWHGIIISPTWHVQKSRWLWQKLDTLLVQTGQSLLEYQGFGRELFCYTGTSVFQSFTNLFSELNDRETVNHNKSNSEKAEKKNYIKKLLKNK